MVLITCKYKIDKDKVEDYSNFTKDVAIPFWLSVEGLKELRGYRELGTGWILAEFEFDSFESWGKVQDSEKCKEILRKNALNTNSASWKIYDKSPLAPKPLKPKK